MTVEKYGNTRNWAVYDDDGELICLTVYKCGANELVRRFGTPPTTPQSQTPQSTVPDKVKEDTSFRYPLRKRTARGC